MLEPDARDAGGYQGLKSAVDGGGWGEGGRDARRGCHCFILIDGSIRWEMANRADSDPLILSPIDVLICISIYSLSFSFLAGCQGFPILNRDSALRFQR